MSDLLLPLLIVLPILAATLPLVAGLVRPRTGWPIALIALLVEAGLAAWLAIAVYLGPESGSRLVHVLGGYGRPEGYAVGIELVADPLSAAVVVLIGTVALGVLAFSRQAGPRGNAFYSAYLLLAGGLMGVSLTGDVFNMFVFLEITGLATYTMVAADDGAEAAVAALKYLIVGTIGASLFLIGVGYLFVSTGTLNMADLATALEGQYTHPTVLAGFGFVAAGLFVKSAIFPLHTWQPDAYAGAPDSVTAYISALVSTVAAYAFARISLTVFTPAFFDAAPIAANAVLALASVSIVAGAALAVTQRSIERTFAYSSVSQFGLIVAAVGIAVHPAATETVTTLPLGTERSPAEWALIGVVVHLVGHGLMKGGLFVAAGALARETGARRISEFGGLGKERPLLSAAMAVLALALVGVPPGVGFVGKWYIALGAVGSGLWPVAAVVLLSTMLTLAYVARLLERLYFTPAESAGHAPADRAVAADGGVGTGAGASFGTVVLVVVVAVLVVALGFAGDLFAEALGPFLTEVYS